MILPKLYIVSDTPKLYERFVHAIETITTTTTTPARASSPRWMMNARLIPTFSPKLIKIDPAMQNELTNMHVEWMTSKTLTENNATQYKFEQDDLFVVDASNVEDALIKLAAISHKLHSNFFITVLFTGDEQDLARTQLCDAFPGERVDAFSANRVLGQERVLVESMLIRQTLYVAGLMGE